ncbi:A24 family peptidase [Labrenzia sp. OB1]|uniref:prepilin peptidase n=1 Tax=Labrenzia sp. OB1 TaxID=1561204 RepID=UPI0007B2795B|nr:A24 family peptidase [Labrenzia sp. OB1]KZM47469.1 hypothetical protein OA90_25720 [Labrenzia sp. OB1]
MATPLAFFLPALVTLLIPLAYFPLTVKIFSVLLFAALCYASYIDLQRMEIPDSVSIGMFPLGALFVLIETPDFLLQRLMGGILVLLLLAVFSRLFFLLRGKEGLGFGDVKLAASATVWIGLPLFAVMIFLAATSGLIASFYRFAMRRQRQPDARIAFGPHLAASIWIVWISTALGLPEAGF